jgi:hypothetical protein
LLLPMPTKICTDFPFLLCNVLDTLCDNFNQLATMDKFWYPVKRHSH